MIPEKLSIDFSPYRLIFKFPAGTSRGVLKEKLTYFIRITDEEDQRHVAFGEVPFFPGLSKETQEEVEEELRNCCAIVNADDLKEAATLSCVRFGIEQALNAMDNEGVVFPSPFMGDEGAITINGLVWMGSYPEMTSRVTRKLQEGFKCIKIKIGAIHWEEELRLIGMVREMGGAEVTIRVDANGAFSPDDVLWRLDELARLGVHSIEQPIMAGNPTAMATVCKESPLPIALDEELIGIDCQDTRSELLEYIRPHYIILKPALCFGFSGAIDWIARAESLGIGGWITSALESSVGLDAIAQFTATLRPDMPQGLGTGNLYTNNFRSPLSLNGDELRYIGPTGVYNRQLASLDWRKV